MNQLFRQRQGNSLPSKYQSLENKRQHLRTTIRKATKLEVLVQRRALCIEQSVEDVLKQLHHIEKEKGKEWNDLILGLTICSKDEQFLRKAAELNLQCCFLKLLQSQILQIESKTTLAQTLLNLIEHRGNVDYPLCEPSFVENICFQIREHHFFNLNSRQYISTLLKLLSLVAAKTESRWIAEYLYSEKDFCAETYSKMQKQLVGEFDFQANNCISSLIRIRTAIISNNFNIRYVIYSLGFIQDCLTEIKHQWKEECSHLLATVLKKCPEYFISQLSLYLLKINSSLLFGLRNYYPETSHNLALSQNLLTIVETIGRRQMKELLFITIKAIPLQFYIGSLGNGPLLKSTLRTLSYIIGELKQFHQETMSNSQKIVKCLLECLSKQIQVTSCLVIIENLTHNLCWTTVVQLLLQQSLIGYVAESFTLYSESPQIIGILIITIDNLLDYASQKGLQKIPRALVSHGICVSLEQLAMSKLCATGDIEKILEQLAPYFRQM